VLKRHQGIRGFDDYDKYKSARMTALRTYLFTLLISVSEKAMSA